MSTNLLTLQYSHNIIEHLGLKLYQNKPTNVIAELISNSWDAEAKNVNIKLNSDTNGEQVIYISDDGIGMSLEDLKSNYLVIGKNKDVDRTGENQSRKPMGRKGIGKLAPFGIANIVTVLTVKSNKINMFELNYDSMLESSKDKNGISIYSPNHIINDRDLEIVSESLETVFGTCDESIIQPCKDFIDSINRSDSKSGTIILLSDLKTKKTINPEMLKKSIGHRFTVTLNTPDFKIKVNDKIIEESDIFPQWALRIPPEGFSSDKIILSKLDNKVVEVKYWVGFVEEAKWLSDETGIGVYAHGKIAQDRPFFFNIRGREIFTRYMYGVVEADWIDELANDEISTDRTSVNWNNEIFDDFKQWGENQVKNWISEFEAFKKNKAKASTKELISKSQSSSKIKLTESEVEHVTQLLSDVTPYIENDEDQKLKIVEATLKAWLHEPARRLIKSLWDETSKFNDLDFSKILLNLEKQLIPESLSLAVVFSQRIYALTKLNQHIKNSKETQLQKLIEEFPWILGNEYEDFVANATLRTVCEKAVAEGEIKTRLLYESDKIERTRPDFVFFETLLSKDILVVELKSPDLTAAEHELDQLRSYITFIKRRLNTSNVKGILIASHFDDIIQDDKPQNIQYLKWGEVLLYSRKNHMQLLAALLAGSNPNPQDSRVQQICELGGKEVVDFLKQMSETNDDLKALMDKLGSV